MDTLGSMVELKVKLVKIGNSLRMTVPVEVIEALKLKEGDTLTVDAKDGKMVVSHIKPKLAICAMCGKPVEFDDGYNMSGTVVHKKCHDEPDPSIVFEKAERSESSIKKEAE